jgi:hypothetical protein
MNRRKRYHLSLALAAVAGLVYSRSTRDWSFGTFYAGLLGVVAIVGLVGLLWTELAPDGDLRRRPQA